MVFMPSGGTVLELRPKGFMEECYQLLAKACSQHHRLILGEGKKTSSLLLDLGEVKRQLDSIRDALVERLKEQGLDASLVPAGSTAPTGAAMHVGESMAKQGPGPGRA